MAYTPASNTTTTSSLAHLATVWYNRRALDQLKQQFRFLGGTEPDIIPQRVGKTVQWFRFSLLPANTTPSAEGVVGAGLQLTTTTVSATVSEYSDFATLSTLLDETAIDPITQNFAEQLGYRAGLSVDTITRNEFDTNSGAVLSTLGPAYTSDDGKRSVALLRALNVRPKLTGEDCFLGIIHPYVVYDLQADNTAGGFIDQARWNNPEILANYAEKLGEGIIGKSGGVLYKTSTNVTTSGTAPNVLYNTYIIGMGAVGSVDLGGRGPTRVENPFVENFKVNVIRGGPQIADPEGKIGSAVSYYFVYVAKTLDSTNLRYKIVQADASLV